MSETDSSTQKFVSGLTPASIAASIFGMFVMAAVIQYAEVILTMTAPAEVAIALPAVLAILVLLGIRAVLMR